MEAVVSRSEMGIKLKFGGRFDHARVSKVKRSEAKVTRCRNFLAAKAS